MSLTTRQKQPFEKLAYDFEFSYPGGIAAAATIASIDDIAAANCGVVSGSAAVVLSGEVFSGRTAQVVIAGGTHGESYKLTCQVTDSAGQKHEVDGILEVIEQ